VAYRRSTATNPCSRVTIDLLLSSVDVPADFITNRRADPPPRCNRRSCVETAAAFATRDCIHARRVCGTELARKLAFSSINRFDPERTEARRQAALADFDDNRRCATVAFRSSIR